jgi:hypothetical protein
MNQFFLVREASPSSSSPQGVAPTEPTAPQPTTGCRHTIPHHASYGNIQSSPTLGAGVRYIMPDYRLVNPRPDLNIVRPYVQNVLYARRSPSPAHTFVVSEHDLISEDDIAPSRYYASWYNPSLVPHSHVPHHTYDEAAVQYAASPASLPLLSGPRYGPSPARQSRTGRADTPTYDCSIANTRRQSRRPAAKPPT